MTKQLTHIDLFSGIGGFALASAWANFETVVFCEKDKFCHKILNKHWPDVPIIEDIHEFKGEQYSGATLLTGGVPCQPASTAGKRRGTEDDRWLWPETFRIIREAKPKWIILENVRGLLALEQGMVFDNLLSEVEALGYETRPFVIPACGVNAPHRRERVWIVAHARHQRFLQQRSIDSHEEQSNSQRRMGQNVLQEKPETKREVLANTSQCSSHDKQLNAGISSQTESTDRKPGDKGGQKPLANTHNTGWGKQQQPISEHQEYTATQCSSGRRALSTMGQLDDGLSSRLVGPEPSIPRVTSTKDRDRVNKLRALGNSIVPQVAYQIIKAISIIEKQK